MSNSKMLKLTLEVSIVTEFRAALQWRESGKIIQVMEMNWNEMIKFS